MSDTPELPSGATEGVPPAPGPSALPGPSGRALSPWRLYLYSVASCGMFLPVWFYRTARIQGAERERRSTPLWWALGSVSLVVCMALLYRFAREAAALGRTEVERVAPGARRAACG